METRKYAEVITKYKLGKAGVHWKVDEFRFAFSKRKLNTIDLRKVNATKIILIWDKTKTIVSKWTVDPDNIIKPHQKILLSNQPYWTSSVQFFFC